MNGNRSIGYAILEHIYSEVTDENVMEADSEPEAAPQPEEQKNDTRQGKECPICKKILPPNANLSFHRMLHPWTDKPYACDHCLFVSMTRDDMTEHCKEAHPEKRKFVCKVCGRIFSNIRTLNKHKPLHAPKLPFHCAYCDRGFPEYVNWRLHEVAHKTARFQCNDCSVRFTTIKSFNDHCATEDCKNKVLECCEQTFSNRNDYVEHCLENHRAKGKIEHQCEYCGRLYAFKYHVNLHKTHCRMRPNKTKPDSNNESQTTPDLTVNDNSESECFATAATRIPVIKDNDDKSEEVYECKKCNKKFRSKSWLAQHTRKHLEGSVTNCTLCNKKYSSYAALYYHRQSKHLGLRRFKCSYCEKAFFSGQALRDHMTSHTGEQPYACNFCPKRFRHRGSKIEHLRIHTGESPYECRFCGQRFKRRHAKAAHERRHTGEKPYKCRVCDRCFTQDSTWRSHERKHKPPFACNRCNDLFTCLVTLVAHKESHVQPEEAPQEEQQVCYVMEENATVQMEAIDNGTVYVQYQVA